MNNIQTKINLVIDAITIANLAHLNQVDKINEPYIRHPLRVGSFFLEQEDYDAAIVGYLHDVVEDTNFISLLSIEATFGQNIKDAVDAISRRKDKETYKEYVRRCCENDLARKVKKQDVKDNMRPERMWKEAPISRYVWTLDYIKENYNE